MDTKSTLSSPARRTRTHCNSPEFEFWMVRNPSFPPPNILSADELFHDGVLLPLHLLSTRHTNKPDSPPKLPDPEPDPSPAITNSASTASKRWKDIFRKSDKKNAEETDNKGKKKDKKSVSSSAELNINIWPFSRSKSAGNVATRPKLTRAPMTRKSYSAPCSRSNSAGESKARKWASSPGRAGVHLGRSSPVWQVRRGSKNSETLFSNPEYHKRETRTTRRNKVVSAGGDSSKARVLNLNVPMCIGYKQNSSCRNIFGGKLSNLRTLFSKKTVLTSH